MKLTWKEVEPGSMFRLFNNVFLIINNNVVDGTRMIDAIKVQHDRHTIMSWRLPTKIFVKSISNAWEILK